MLSEFGLPIIGDNDRAHLIEQLVAWITPFYDQFHRHYHTINHVCQMFGDAEDLEWQLTLEEILAIVYHDAIWFPSNDAIAVAASIELLRSHISLLPWLEQYAQCKGYYLPNIIERTANIIQDTHSHIPTTSLVYNDLDNGITLNSSRVVDLDMYGFCCADRQQKINAQLVAEYGNQPKNRIKFLQMMLQRQPFYYNLSESYSSKAYTIILNELSQLMTQNEETYNG